MSISDSDPTRDPLRRNQRAAEDVEFGESEEISSQGLSGFVRSQVEINRAIVNHLGEMRNDITDIRNDIGQVKGGHARAEVIRNARLIAPDLGMNHLREVERDELVAWSNSFAGEVDERVLRSFQHADLVIEADDGSGYVYLMVEIAYTIDNSDVRRALRNAELLREYTSHRAEAVVAGVEVRPGAQDQINQGIVRWFEVKRGILDPE